MDKVVERLNALLSVSDKSQKQIAEELGYERANIITMMKKGTCKVPINKVGKLAHILNADPSHMVRLALEVYMPDTFAAIQDHLGGMISANEREILNVVRKASRESDPKMNVVQKEQLRDMFKA